MNTLARPEHPQLPEGLVKSRHVGWIDSEKLPWLQNEACDPQVGLSRLTFDHGGKIYVASAGTARLNKISAAVREKEPTKGLAYTRSDELFLRGCKMYASGVDVVATSLITTILEQSAAFDGFALEGIREASRPNAKRIYLARTTVGKLRPTLFKGEEVEPEAQLLIRLVTTDKDNQVKAHKALVTTSDRTLRKSGMGSV